MIYAWELSPKNTCIISGVLTVTDQYPPITTLGHSRGTGKHAHPDSKSSLILHYYRNVAQSFKNHFLSKAVLTVAYVAMFTVTKRAAETFYQPSNLSGF